MEKIKDIKNFTICINCLQKIMPTGRLITKDNKTIISVFDGITFILCEIPELTEKYNNNVDLRILLKLCKTLKEKDILNLSIKEDLIEAKITRKKTERKYSFPNIQDDENEKGDKAIEKAINLNPVNEVQTTSEWLHEQMDGLIFKDIDKSFQKIKLSLKEKVFYLSDDNKTSGSSIISLFAFDEYKIKFKNPCNVKINYHILKEIIPQLKQFSEKLLIKMDTDYPLKLISYDNKYKMTIIVAPVIED